MSAELKAPCEIKNTLCQKIVQDRINVSPCWLKAAGQCRPINTYLDNVNSGMPPKLAKSEMQVDAHTTCPFTIDILYNPDGTANNDMHALFNKIRTGSLDYEDYHRWTQMVIEDLKNGNLEAPLISPKKK